MNRAERRRVYRSARWRRLRRMVLERAGNRCARCGGAGRLEVHHRRPLACGGDPFDATNLQALCRRCHFSTEPVRRPRGTAAAGAAWREAIDAGA